MKWLTNSCYSEIIWGNRAICFEKSSCLSNIRLPPKNMFLVGNCAFGGTAYGGKAVLRKFQTSTMDSGQITQVCSYEKLDWIKQQVSKWQRNPSCIAQTPSCAVASLDQQPNVNNRLETIMVDSRFTTGWSIINVAPKIIVSLWKTTENHMR